MLCNKFRPRYQPRKKRKKNGTRTLSRVKYTAKFTIMLVYVLGRVYGFHQLSVLCHQRGVEERLSSSGSWSIADIVTIHGSSEYLNTVIFMRGSADKSRQPLTIRIKTPRYPKQRENNKLANVLNSKSASVLNDSLLLRLAQIVMNDATTVDMIAHSRYLRVLHCDDMSLAEWPSPRLDCNH